MEVIIRRRANSVPVATEAKGQPSGPVATPPKAAKKQKKPLSEKEEALKRIVFLRKRIKKIPYVQRVYDRISEKYGIDLRSWISKQDNLPRDDYGLKLVKFLDRTENYPEQLKLLEEVCKKHGWSAGENETGK